MSWWGKITSLGLLQDAHTAHTSPTTKISNENYGQITKMGEDHVHTQSHDNYYCPN